MQGIEIKDMNRARSVSLLKDLGGISVHSNCYQPLQPLTSFSLIILYISLCLCGGEKEKERVGFIGD